MSQVHFKNIQNIIIQNLQKAQFKIVIAVAWFTDERIIKVLENCIVNNINISLLLNDDRINNKELFRLLMSKGADIRFTKKLMHNKFCVIDDHILLNGSYNWTYNAKHNNENIQVIVDHFISYDYITEFNKLATLGIPIKEYLKSDEEEIADFIKEQNLNYAFPYFIRKEVMISDIKLFSKAQIYYFLIRSLDDIKKLKKETKNYISGFSKFTKTDYDKDLYKYMILQFDFVMSDKISENGIIYFEKDTYVVENYYQKTQYETYGRAYIINRDGERIVGIYFDLKDSDGNYISRIAQGKQIIYDNNLNRIN